MLEICFSGFLVLSIAVSVLLWRALATAKQADYRLGELGGRHLVEHGEGSVPLMGLMATSND